MGLETHATRATIRVVARRTLSDDVTRSSLARAQPCSTLNMVVHGLARKNGAVDDLRAVDEGRAGGGCMRADLGGGARLLVYAMTTASFFD
jgi:hypothetical protein